MAKEYIEREALMEQLVKKKAGIADKRYTEGFNDALMRFRSMVHSAKAADVVEVAHGRWIPTSEYDSCWCSCCKKQYTGFFASYWNYCPNCGARMDGE